MVTVLSFSRHYHHCTLSDYCFRSVMTKHLKDTHLIHVLSIHVHNYVYVCSYEVYFFCPFLYICV